MSELENSTHLPAFHSDEFLPPLSRWTTIGSLGAVITLGVLVGLASVIEYRPRIPIEVIVHPAGNIPLVQATQDGVVKTILVTENQSVQSGEIIGYLDETHLRTQKHHLEDEIHQCQLELKQINQQLDYLEGQIVATAQSLITGAVPMGTESSAPPILSIETALVQLAMSRPEMGQQMAQERRTLLTKRTELQKEIIQGQRELYQVGEKLSQMTLRATVDGTISELKLHNPGQLVKVGDTIAYIVPSQVPLVIKGQVSPPVVAQIKVGQAVETRMIAYPFPQYGTIPGIITEISAENLWRDSVIDPSYYEVTIAPDLTHFTKDGREYLLQAGMEGRGDILLSPETLLTFFWKKLRFLTHW